MTRAFVTLSIRYAIISSSELSIVYNDHYTLICWDSDGHSSMSLIVTECTSVLLLTGQWKTNFSFFFTQSFVCQNCCTLYVRKFDEISEFFSCFWKELHWIILVFIAQFLHFTLLTTRRFTPRCFFLKYLNIFTPQFSTNLEISPLNSPLFSASFGKNLNKKYWKVAEIELF